MVQGQYAIMLKKDDFRMLKMLSAESGEPMSDIIHHLLKIIYERVEYAYENEAVPPGMDGYSLLIFKALHLKKVRGLTEEEFKSILKNVNLHQLIDKVFEADGLTERRKIMEGWGSKSN